MVPDEKNILRSQKNICLTIIKIFVWELPTQPYQEIISLQSINVTNSWTLCMQFQMVYKNV
jgi:hypothetical protein